MREAKPGFELLWQRLKAAQPSGVQAQGLVELGRIGDPYGVKGWVNVHPHSGDNTALKHAKRWFLKYAAPVGSTGAFSSTAGPQAGSEALQVAIVSSRMHSGRLVAQIDGIEDRTQAEFLKGIQVWVERSAFPPLKKGEFYWVDLIGLSVINREGVCLGTVSEVSDHGAHPILYIDAGPGQEECLIPFVPAYIDKVDMAGKAITVDWQLDY